MDAEQAVVFDCEGMRLVGVATQPERPGEIGVLILVGGRQYRAGSHRQFVLLARRLASADFSSFRFDFRGMGDSEGERRSFEEVDADIAAALAAFRAACPAVQRVVLWGLCDAATAAVLYWQRTHDPLVAGLCLANPWLRSTASLARRGCGTITPTGPLIRSSGASCCAATFVPCVPCASTWSSGAFRAFPGGEFRADHDRRPESFPGPIQLLLSGRDLTAKEFVDSLAAAGAGEVLQQGNVTRTDFATADHTFSHSDWQSEGGAGNLGWLAAELRR